VLRYYSFKNLHTSQINSLIIYRVLISIYLDLVWVRVYPCPAHTQQIHNRHGHARRRELGLRSLCVAAALQAALVLLHGTACISATGSWSTYTIVQLRRGQTSQHDAKLRGQPARRRTYGTGQDTATGVGTAWCRISRRLRKICAHGPCSPVKRRTWPGMGFAETFGRQTIRC